jgi:hypothetical protein
VKQLITNSGAKEARACLRAYEHSYVNLMRPLHAAEPLWFGDVVHGGLGAWWLSPAVDERLDRAFAAIAGRIDDAFLRAKAEAMLIGYDARWRNQRYVALLIEQRFRLPLVNPITGEVSERWDVGGKVDGVVRDLDTNRVLLMEHKTASGDIRPGADYWKKLRLDSQISTYYRGVGALDVEIDGTLYDVLGKPGQIPLKATPVEARKYRRRTARSTRTSGSRTRRPTSTGTGSSRR